MPLEGKFMLVTISSEMIGVAFHARLQRKHQNWPTGGSRQKQAPGETWALPLLGFHGKCRAGRQLRSG